MRQVLISARKKSGKKVTEIASQLGISASLYYKIEQGTRNPTIYLAKEIADIFNTTLEGLFFSEDLDVSSNNDIKPTGTEGG